MGAIRTCNLHRLRAVRRQVLAATAARAGLKRPAAPVGPNPAAS